MLLGLWGCSCRGVHLRALVHSMHVELVLIKAF